MLHCRLQQWGLLGLIQAELWAFIIKRGGRRRFPPLPEQGEQQHDDVGVFKVSNGANLKWISSFGGPYLCTSPELAKKWLGTEGLSFQGIQGDVATDYELACGTRDYAGLLGERFCRLLVIGDLPEQLCWIAVSGEEGIFIKWIGADSDEQVLSVISDMQKQQFTVLPVSFLVESDSLVVFDSACKADELEDNFLAPELLPGIYSVSYLNYEPDDFLMLNVIRLRKEPGHP